MQIGFLKCRQAIFSDPQGAVFALVASSTGDPPDVLLEPDRWIWSTVLVHDVQIDAAFYRANLGYAIDVFPRTKAYSKKYWSLVDMRARPSMRYRMMVQDYIHGGSTL